MDSEADRYLGYIAEIREFVLKPNDDLTDYWLGGCMGEPYEVVGAVQARMAQLNDLLPLSVYKDSPIEGRYYHAKMEWQEAASAVSALIRLQRKLTDKNEKGLLQFAIDKAKEERDTLADRLKYFSKQRDDDVDPA